MTPERVSRSQQIRVMAIRAAMVAVVAVCLLLMPIPLEGRGWRAIGDLWHAPLFGALAFAAMGALERVWPTRDQIVRLCVRGGLLIVFLSACGALMELVQQSFSRSASWHDAMANTLGIIAAVFCYVALRLRSVRADHRWMSRMLFAAAGCLLALAWYAPSIVLMDVVNVRRNFPMLASFESPAELQRFWFADSNARRQRKDATDGRYSMDVVFEPTDFPRFSLIELKQDWSSFEAMELDVRLVRPESDVEFLVKILDQSRSDDQDAFRRTWILQGDGMKRLRIERKDLVSAEGRVLDLSGIDYVDFGLVQPPGETRLSVDRIRLIQ